MRRHFGNIQGLMKSRPDLAEGVGAVFHFELIGKYYVLVRGASSGSAIGGMFGNMQGLMKSRPDLA